MQFGIFDQNDIGAADLTAHYEARLQLAAFYDQAGFDRYHVSEHHATPLSATPATGAWLSAVAQRTTRIRLGPLVYILPLRHPLQVAEEVCLLDHLSNGRFELGVGRGVSPFELGYHGVDAAESPAMLREGLDLLLRALTQDEVSFEGRSGNAATCPSCCGPSSSRTRRSGCRAPRWSTPRAPRRAASPRSATGRPTHRRDRRALPQRMDAGRRRCPASACRAPWSSPRRGGGAGGRAARLAGACLSFLKLWRRHGARRSTR